MSSIPRLSSFITFSTQVKVIADKALVAFTRETALTTGITADTYHNDCRGKGVRGERKEVRREREKGEMEGEGKERERERGNGWGR